MLYFILKCLHKQPENKKRFNNLSNFYQCSSGVGSRIYMEAQGVLQKRFVSKTHIAIYIAVGDDSFTCKNCFSFLLDAQ